METKERERLRERETWRIHRKCLQTYIELSVVASSEVGIEQKGKNTGNFNLIYEFLVEVFYTSLYYFCNFS